MAAIAQPVRGGVSRTLADDCEAQWRPVVLLCAVLAAGRWLRRRTLTDKVLVRAQPTPPTAGVLGRSRLYLHSARRQADRITRSVLYLIATRLWRRAWLVSRRSAPSPGPGPELVEEWPFLENCVTSTSSSRNRTLFLNRKMNQQLTSRQIITSEINGEEARVCVSNCLRVHVRASSRTTTLLDGSAMCLSVCLSVCLSWVLLLFVLRSAPNIRAEVSGRADIGAHHALGEDGMQVGHHALHGGVTGCGDVGGLDGPADGQRRHANMAVQLPRHHLRASE